MTRDEVIAHLKALADNKVQPLHVDNGLCIELDAVCGVGECSDLVYSAADSWKHFSGNPAFPIPDPCGKEEPSSQYCRAPDMWSPSSPYGALRRDLCRHVAKYLEANPDVEL